MVRNAKSDQQTRRPTRKKVELCQEGQMHVKAYRVEEIEFEEVVSKYSIEACTPFEAAARATRRPVTLRRGEADWIRVMEIDFKGADVGRPVEYQYHGLGRRP